MKRYFAFLKDGVVVTVIVARSMPEGTGWIETWRDRSRRVHFAGIGFTYDSELDAFIPPKPFESWVLDEATCLWNAPVPMPEDGQMYVWDESAGEWVVSE